MATIGVDAVSCYLAAQVFGGDQLSTLSVTLLFLAGLAAGVFALDLAGRRKARIAWRWIVGLLAAFIVVLGILRFAYLLTVNGGLLTALLGAGLVTVTTGVLVALRLLGAAGGRARRALQAAPVPAEGAATGRGP